MAGAGAPLLGRLATTRDLPEVGVLLWLGLWLEPGAPLLNTGDLPEVGVLLWLGLWLEPGLPCWSLEPRLSCWLLPLPGHSQLRQ